VTAERPTGSGTKRPKRPQGTATQLRQVLVIDDSVVSYDETWGVYVPVLVEDHNLLVIVCLSDVGTETTPQRRPLLSIVGEETTG
jgi:hypothetical protein